MPNNATTNTTGGDSALFNGFHVVNGNAIIDARDTLQNISDSAFREGMFFVGSRQQRPTPLPIGKTGKDFEKVMLSSYE